MYPVPAERRRLPAVPLRFGRCPPGKPARMPVQKPCRRPSAWESSRPPGPRAGRRPAAAACPAALIRPAAKACPAAPIRPAGRSLQRAIFAVCRFLFYSGIRFKRTLRRFGEAAGAGKGAVLHQPSVYQDKSPINGMKRRKCHERSVRCPGAGAGAGTGRSPPSGAPAGPGAVSGRTGLAGPARSGISGRRSLARPPHRRPRAGCPVRPAAI